MAIGRSCLPYMQRQRQKTRAIRERTTREKIKNISRQQHRENAQLAEDKRTRIWEDLNEHWRTQEALAEELAKKHGKTIGWMKNALQRVGKYGAKRRVVNPYNAWLHVKSLELNDSLDHGEKADVIALQQKAKEVSSWKDIAQEDMDKMVGLLEKKRMLVKKGIRTRPLSQLQTVRQAHKRFDDDLISLGHTCKISSLLVMARTTSAYTSPPFWSADQVSKDFIEIVLGWDINEFCLKFEAFALFRLKGIAMNHNDKVLFTRRRVRTLVRRGLHMFMSTQLYRRLLTDCAINKGEITGNKAVEMSWKNYETDIVDEYHVVLEGWPKVAFDPAKVGFKFLDVIMKALESGECGWVKLTDEQFKDRKEKLAGQMSLRMGEQRRKQRSDKGKKRGPYKDKKSCNIASDSDLDESLGSQSSD